MAAHQEDVTDPTTVTVIREKDEEHYVVAEDIVKGAQKATDNEHAMGLREGLRKYPKAVCWSIWFSSALIMEGFDHSFVSGFMAFPAFQRRYGVLTKNGSYQVPANLQAAVSNGVNAGEIVGLLLNGLLCDWFGYRWLMMGSLFLMGSEVCPNVLRPYLTMLVSLAWSIGYLTGTCVLRGFLSMSGEWAYRIPFALQWALPIPLAIGIYLAPESPWWLIRKGRTEDATKSLRRLRTKDASEEEIADTLAMMLHTVKIEDEMNASSSYWDLFRGVDRRRTEITVFTYLIQELCAPLVAYIVYFLEQSGLDPSSSFDFGIGEYALAIVGVCVAWCLVPRVGRRTLLLSGTFFMTATTILIGFLGIVSRKTHPKIGYGIGTILLIEYFVFFITIGPIIYTIVTEIPSNALRTKSVGLARALYNVGVLVYGQLAPRMMQQVAWDWGAKCGFFFGGIMGLSLLWAYFRLSETKNRTFAEVDILFKNKVPARKFPETRVDLASEEVR
ncbi:putative MFS alpha-glucoside transporter [Aspergillus fischeri NRRL 181]|uniref:Maltose permease n=1 Tax=Neosartorya fischeri (strain ATCC 1020 / DSM 3700 / CBS 544.65 / FGSC A1164 / JCM 1740 / NRRL 181 / WB 181) TaxID=331117 RepID=A1DCJ9_NEOFI|nr:maltose permease [Aspergillus fischeri NRRL 181]EAW19559.1 maltose permease [Aspergillus fischeri NRRL 181]